MPIDALDVLNEKRDRCRAIEAVLATAPVPLAELIDPAPGTYVLLYRGALDLYSRLRRPCHQDDLRSMSEAGGAPIYVGSASSLRERRRRHERNVRACIDVDSNDLLVVALPTRTLAGALYVERLLMDAFRPVWNQPFLSGFGSKPQGTTRTRHQRIPRWSVLHPGRHSVPQTANDEQRARLAQRVTEHLQATVSDPYGRVAPALTR